MALCMACYKAAATESCLLCGKRVCKADFAGNGLCMGCAGGRKIIGYFSNLEGEKTQESSGIKQGTGERVKNEHLASGKKEAMREPKKTTGSKRYIP